MALKAFKVQAISAAPAHAAQFKRRPEPVIGAFAGAVSLKLPCAGEIQSEKCECLIACQGTGAALSSDPAVAALCEKMLIPAVMNGPQWNLLSSWTASQQTNQPMSIELLIDQAVILAYRLAGYAMVNLIDDAAMMALLFC